MSQAVANFDPSAPAQVDYMVPARGVSSSSFAATLLNNELDVACLRPYIGKRGHTYIDRTIVGHDGKPKVVATRVNNDGTLRQQDWMLIDQEVQEAARTPLRVVADLRGAGLVQNLPGGMANTVLQFNRVSDITPATISMDGLRESESDRPVFSTVNYPLPLIHKDFQFSLREVLASRRGNAALDTTTSRLAGQKVAEAAESLALGASGVLGGPTSFSYAGSGIYGIFNSPNRITTTITVPTTLGWVPNDLIGQILNAMLLAQQSGYPGPYRLYFGMSWLPYLGDDYSATSTGTLLARLQQIPRITGIDILDTLQDFSFALVQQDRSVIRMVIGLDITTIQWESHGGMQLNFKVIALMVPLIQSNSSGDTGIVTAA